MLDLPRYATPPGEQRIAWVSRSARIWWRLRRQRHDGALVAVHVGPALLLVRSSYRIAWNFPGGTIRRGETPEMAARRELAEEIGPAGYRLLAPRAASGTGASPDRVTTKDLNELDAFQIRGRRAGKDFPTLDRSFRSWRREFRT
jgi:8-oxo-dGTP pyrophosphatase MutT (NUDIX family)